MAHWPSATTEAALRLVAAGEGAVVRHAMTIPPYAETRRYVPAVMAKYDEWRAAEKGARRIDYLVGTRLTAIR